MERNVVRLSGLCTNVNKDRKKIGCDQQVFSIYERIENWRIYQYFLSGGNKKGRGVV